jgi:hypothetical protein
MAQPVWITPAGNLGSIAEGQFYNLVLQAYDPDSQPVYFEVIAGQLPAGMVVDNNTGIMAGVPQAVAVLEGVPSQVSQNVTSKFAIRAYTKTVLGTVARLADRTFEITVTAQNAPEFTTPPGNIATYFDGTQVFDLQIGYTDVDPTDLVVVKLAGGLLPPGLTINSSGVISGFIQPNTNTGAAAGFSRDGQGYDQYAFDFSTKSSTVNYEFVLELTDGKSSNLRAFTILVYSRDSCTADDTQFTADNTFLTADCSPTRTPILLNPQGSIGTVRNDNFFAFKFNGLDLDGDQITYTISLGGTIGFDLATISFTPGSYDYTGESFDQGGFTLPPGLQLDPNTGWLYGFIPDLGITELTYDFSIRVYKTIDPTIVSQYYYYSLNIIGNLSTQVTWLTPVDPVERARVPSLLGFIDNGAISTLYVQAINVSGIPLQYRLQSGSTSSLPQGLQLLPEGDIAGRVSFDTFALDGGTTTFDVKANPFNNPNSNPTTGVGTATTFDMVHTFTVEAYSVNGVVSVFKTFSICVVRRYNEPFDNLYLQAMPPQNDRELLNSLLQNADIFPQDLLYRPQDPNFGLATKVIYEHAYGLTAATLDSYVEALNLNHYWKNLVLGSIETAQALDADGNIIYEVVYSRVVDDLINNAGESVGKEVTLPYTIDVNGQATTTVYPNSLVDMRTQVIDTVGQISNVLPRWMLSKQVDGRTLGFTPAWVIAYTKPGKSGQIKYNIETIFGNQLNLVDFDVDRYELDNLLTKNWNREEQQWIPTPAEATTFDLGGIRTINGWININGNTVQWISNSGRPVNWVATVDNYTGAPTVFDGNSLQFIAPVDMYSSTQVYDKYLLFPKRNILG